MISIENLNFSFDSNTLFFKNLSLHIQRNEKVSIIGTNGSGKSTFLKLLIGLYGHEIINESFAYLPQVHQSNFQGTTKEYIEIILGHNNSVDIPAPLLEEKYEHLSGGQKQLLLLTLLLKQDKQIYLLDEPFSFLDPFYKLKVEEMIKHLEGKTTIVVTHDLDFARNWSDKILILSQGSFQCVDTQDSDKLKKALEEIFCVKFEEKPSWGGVLE